jgi:hypothetical protein
MRTSGSARRAACRSAWTSSSPVWPKSSYQWPTAPNRRGGQLDLVRLVLQLGLRAPRADGRGEDEPPRPLAAQRAQRRLRRRAGRDAVVDEDDDAALDARRRPIAAVRPAAPRGLLALPRLDARGVRRRHAERRQGRGVQDPLVAGDGAERQLGVARDAQLARHEDVELAADGLGDLVGDGDAPARQRQHERVLPGQAPQPRRQAPAGLPPVAEQRSPHGKRSGRAAFHLSLEAGRKGGFRRRFLRP